MLPRSLSLQANARGWGRWRPRKATRGIGINGLLRLAPEQPASWMIVAERDRSARPRSTIGLPRRRSACSWRIILDRRDAGSSPPRPRAPVVTPPNAAGGWVEVQRLVLRSLSSRAVYLCSGRREL